ncbi:hypothetical protein PUMCH_000059 [Australozyma saopauloensis]|uniref:Nucleoporin n=1 Tax=Australozyma saopauloensis TaxID=291208 RepID=A0AAX4H2T4_9ASCO|nr:hypothetical protein PUMCH_000059 [[Candida] saopauloensis]
MSILASVILGKPSLAPADDTRAPQQGTNGHKYLAPTITLAHDDSDKIEFQRGNNEAASSQPSRFYLPMVLDSVNEVNYKINVPNFASLPPLRLSSKYISDLIRVDSMTPGDLYGPNNLSKSTGLDNYYFDKSAGLGDFSRFEKVSQLDLPDRFFEEYNMTKVSTRMGLFSEINRSWIAVDNKLVLWNYQLPQSSFNQSSQFLTIDQIRHSVITVALVKPKKGVFVEDVNHLLLISTAMDIFIYVVKYDAASNNLEIFNPNLSVSTQGLIVNKFIMNEETNDIYFTGEGDGVNVWRLDYHKNVSFLKNKCDKVCLTKSALSSVLPIGKIPGFDLFTHETDYKSTEKKDQGKNTVIPESITQLEVDSGRQLLYTLSNRSVIRVYKLQPNQELFAQHSVLTPHEMFKTLTQLIPDSSNIKAFLKFRIISISRVTSQESSNVQLIATTNYGARILLKLGYSSSLPSFASSTIRNTTSLKLSVVCMKFPPANDEPKVNSELDNYARIKQYVAIMVTNQQNSGLLKNTKFAKILSPGVFLAVQKTTGSDKLFIASVNYGFLKHNNKLVEDAEFLSFGSAKKDSESAPVYVHDIIQLTPSMNATNTPNGYANIQAAQYTKKPLQFAVLTNYGISIYQYRTSDKILSSLNDQVVENFIEENGYEETCSSLLYLACSYGVHRADELMKSKAQLLFSHAGNNARLIENSSVSAQLHHVPIQPLEQQPMAEQVILSDRFYGTCLLISRLLKDLWNEKVFTALPHIKLHPSGEIEVSSVKEDNLILKDLTVNKAQTEFFVGSIVVLIEFFNENSNKIPGLDAPTYSADPSKFDNEICSRTEHIAFTSLIRSLNSMKEAFSFLMVLIEETQSHQNNFNEVFKYLSLTNQLNLLKLRFKDLLLPTAEVKNLIKDLLSSIINKNILKGGSIDLIASSLQGRCGSFCSTNDVYIFKAIENLTRAKSIGNRDVELKLKCLNNAVSLFEEASDSLTFENIENSVDIMLSLDFSTGAVEFLLKLASRLYNFPSARSNGMSSTNENNPHDIKKHMEENSRKRTKLYDLIFKILVKLDTKALQINELNNQYLINEFSEVRDLTYDTCFSSSDKAFHYEFYRWFISRGCSERLLTVETPFILPFLEELSNNDLALTELLWLYHARRQSYEQAATILFSLAISEFPLNLEKRIEYLSRANGFCNCTCPPSIRQKMIQLAALIQEIFDVANVQLDLVNTIKQDKRIKGENKDSAITALSCKIQNASELFNGYADPLGYYEICFKIFCISDYKNPDDILKRWELYFESTFHEFLASKKKSQPLYSILSDSISNVGRKVSCNDSVFPVRKLMKLMCKFIFNAIEEIGQDQTPPAGVVVETFLKSGISFETLYAVIKSSITQNSNELTEPYHLFIEKLQSKEMVYLIQHWYKNDQNMMSSIPKESILTMTEYSVEKDPLERWVKTQNSFI